MILDMFSLKGKVAVVTGANTGLGQGMAVALAQAGATGVSINGIWAWNLANILCGSIAMLRTTIASFRMN